MVKLHLIYQIDESTSEQSIELLSVIVYTILSHFRLNAESKTWSKVSPTNTDNGPMKKGYSGMAAIKINTKDHLLLIGGYGPINNNTPHQHNALYKAASTGRHVYTNEIHYYDLSSSK